MVHMYAYVSTKHIILQFSSKISYFVDGIIIWSKKEQILHKSSRWLHDFFGASKNCLKENTASQFSWISSLFFEVNRFYEQISNSISHI